MGIASDWLPCSTTTQKHYLVLGSASDWLEQISRAARPTRSTTRIWVVTRHQYGISALVPQTLFCGDTSGSDKRKEMSALFSGYDFFGLNFSANYYDTFRNLSL